MSGAATPQGRVVVLEWLVGLGVVVAVSTEALSFFGILSRLSVSLLWLAVAGAAVLSVARTGRWHVPTIRLPRDRELCLWMGMGALVIAMVGLIALAAAPGTADAMIYHLSRVMHWIANGSVDFYPTAIPRQLHMAPFAEYTILHSMLVTGRDILVNVTQWVALVGGALAVSLITAQFGAPRAAQAFSAVLFLTAPIVLLEGSSTQNDLVAAMWCLLVVAFGLQRRVTTRAVVVTTCALGLAALTKATTYLALAPFVPLVALTWIRHLSGPVRVRSLLLLVLMPLLLNGPQYVRNMDVTGSPLGPTTEGGGYKYTNDEWGLGFVSSNVVRNTAAELRSLSPFFNGFVQRAADRIHDELGVATDDPRTTWPDVTFDVMAPVRNEASSGNPLQFLLGIAAAVLLLIRPGPEAAAVRSYVVALLVAALLFCVVLRWQPWHPRLHISLIALSLPLVGTGLSGARHRSMRLALGLAAFLYATPFLIAGDDRPLLGASSVLSASRQSQYFAAARGLEASYVGIAERLRTTGCTQVGLALGPSDFEYPLWALANVGSGEPVAFRHLQFPAHDRAPHAAGPFCALVAFDWYELPVEGSWFCRDVAFERLTLYERSDRPCPGFLESAGLEIDGAILDLVFNGDGALETDRLRVSGQDRLPLQRIAGEVARLERETTVRIAITGPAVRLAMALEGRADNTGPRVTVRLDGEAIITWSAESEWDTHVVLLPPIGGEHSVTIEREPSAGAVELLHIQLAVAGPDRG